MSNIDPHVPGAKLDAGKPRMHLVFSAFANALTEVAEVGTYGANKYSPNGWLEVPNGFERYSDALHRHLTLESTEGMFDIEGGSGMYHAAQVAWNALARLELLLREQKAQHGSY